MLDITFKYTHHNLLMSCPGKPLNFQKETTEKRTVKEFLTKHKKKMKKKAHLTACKYCNFLTKTFGMTTIIINCMCQNSHQLSKVLGQHEVCDSNVYHHFS